MHLVTVKILIPKYKQALTLNLKTYTNKKLINKKLTLNNFHKTIAQHYPKI